MAIFAEETFACISHLLPTDEEVERHFGNGGSGEEAYVEDNSFDLTLQLSQEHLEALEEYRQLLEDDVECEDEQGFKAEIYDFLKEAKDRSYPFGFWNECHLMSPERNTAIAMIILMMSSEALSPLESIHALFTAAMEAANGDFEFEEDDYELLSAAIEDSMGKLLAYVAPQRRPVVGALLDNYLEAIDRGEELMDRQLFAIESVYLKLISAH